MSVRSRSGRVALAVGVVAFSQVAIVDVADAVGARVSAGTVVEVTVPEGVGGKLIIGNLAVDEQSAVGFVTAYPCDHERPLASDLNYLPGPPQSNRFIGSAGADGRICFSSFGPTHLIFDANAVVTSGTSFPNRRLDTRAGPIVAAGAVVEVSVPEAVGGKVVVGNLAADRQTREGFVTAYPCDAPKPLASDLNFSFVGAGSNRFVGRASQDGRICLSPNVATHLVFDATPILPGAVPFPNRRFDTRGGPRVEPATPLQVFIPEAVGGKTVIGNLAVDNQLAPGFVTGYPCAEARPLASDLNFREFPATSNRFIGHADVNGNLCFFANVPTDIIFDVAATLTDATPFINRRTDTRDGPAPASCSAAQLTTRTEFRGAASSHDRFDVELTNSGATCALGGFPTVAGVTGGGAIRQLATTQGTYFPSPAPLTSIVTDETVVGVLADGRACDDYLAGRRQTWAALRLSFPSGTTITVDAGGIDTTCGIAVSQFGAQRID